MFNVAFMWKTDFLEHIKSKYVLDYDYRMHALQSSLIALFQNDMDLGILINYNIKFSDIRFGYFDTETNRLCRVFAKHFNILDVLSNTFYSSVFNASLEKLNMVFFYSYEDERIFIASLKDRDLNGIIDLDDLATEDFSQHSKNEEIKDVIETEFEVATEYIPYAKSVSESLSILNQGYPRRLNFSDIDPDSIDQNMLYSTEEIEESLNANIYDSFFSSKELKIAENEYVNNNSFAFYKGSQLESRQRLTNEIYTSNDLFNDFEAYWKSTSQFPIQTISDITHEGSQKYQTFFQSGYSSTIRKASYDITVVYGADKEFSQKLIEVTPRSYSQEVNASGEAIYTIIEFVAKDLVQSRR